MNSEKLTVWKTPTARLKLIEIYLFTRSRWGQDQAKKYLMLLEQIIQDIAVGTKSTKMNAKFSTRFSYYTVKKHHLFFEYRDDKLILATVFHTARQVKDRMEEELPKIQREIKKI